MMQTDLSLTELSEKAKKIKLLALDVDGILSDGKLIYDANGIESKAFFVQDGVGIKAVQQFGIQVAIITGRTSPMVEKRATELGIDQVIQGRDDKLTALIEVCQRLDLTLEECAYMGDDLPDIRALKAVGFSASVPNAHDEVKISVDFLTEKAGGAGAVREVCDLLLQAQDHYADFINQYL